MESKVQIFLLQKPITDEIIGLLQNKKITYLDRKDYFESANDTTFNESKFMGTFALKVALGQSVILTEPETFITKKGGLSLSYHIGTRANNIPHQFILISDKDIKDSNNDKSQDKIRKCVHEVITFEQFEKYNVNEVKTEIETELNKIKVTCGLLAKAGNVTGHITRAFGISYDESKIIEENNAIHFDKIYSGHNIKLTVNGKEGGSVISIPSLGKLAHITNNTVIRSVLSGPVLEKYENDIFEFGLKDIDKAAKQDLPIKLEKGDKMDVLISGWYCYAI